MKPGSTADVLTAPASGLTAVGGLTACSNSRRATASSVHAAGDCTGAVGALLANGDRTAFITVDTTRDNGSAGVGVMAVDADAFTAGAALEDVGAAEIAATGSAATDGVDDVAAAAVGASTARGFRLVFADVLPGAGREVTRPFRRAVVPGSSSAAVVVGASFNEVEVDGVRAVLVSGSTLLFTASCGFSGRRGRLGASFVAEVEPGCFDELDCDDSPDDEPFPLSAGSANATAGVLATARPTPSATANADMQPMCFALSMGGLPSLHPRCIKGDVEQSLYGFTVSRSPWFKS
jgi:hypothetical protein